MSRTCRAGIGSNQWFRCRELLRCESALARLYCRMALLNIFAPKNPHTFTRLFHIPAIRDITLEHLQLLSNQLLAPPLPGQCSRSFSLCLISCVANTCVLIAVMLSPPPPQMELLVLAPFCWLSLCSTTFRAKAAPPLSSSTRVMLSPSRSG